MSSDNTLLIENEGEVAHTWSGVMEPRFSVQLQGNRMLLRTLDISQDGMRALATMFKEFLLMAMSFGTMIVCHRLFISS